MAQIQVAGVDGMLRSLTAATGTSAMEAIRDGGFEEMLALCGGGCACATCHVYVADDWLNRLAPQSEDENDLLDSSVHRRPNSRLSCQIVMNEELDGLSLTIAPAV